MEQILDDAAERERAEHEYVSRTGDLNLSTRSSVIVDSPNLVQIDLEMTEEYAEYIVDKGLSTIEDQVIRADTEIEAELNG